MVAALQDELLREREPRLQREDGLQLDDVVERGDRLLGSVHAAVTPTSSKGRISSTPSSPSSSTPLMTSSVPGRQLVHVLAAVCTGRSLLPLEYSEAQASTMPVSLGGTPRPEWFQSSVFACHSFQKYGVVLVRFDASSDDRAGMKVG